MAVEGGREAAAIAATLGGMLRPARLRSRRRQKDMGQIVGLSASRYGEVERGGGATLPLATWVALGLAIGRPLSVAFSRPVPGEPADAGHLEIQEFLLDLARRTGRRGTFELPTRPADPWRSVDVGLQDDRRRELVLVEAWNTIGDLGAARRSTTRKLAEAEQLAAALGGERPFRVAAVWVVRASATNRGLVARYPAVIDAACPGSSARWLRALETGAGAPEGGVGFLWWDPSRHRLSARRRSGGKTQTGATISIGSPNREKS